MINVQKQQQQSEDKSITCLNSLTIQELFKQTLQNLYSQKYFRKHADKFPEAIFVFQLFYQDRYWILIKNNQELMGFIKDKDIQYKLSQKTRQSLDKQTETSLQSQARLFQSALAQFLAGNPQGFKLPFFQYERDGYGGFIMNKRSGGRYRETACCKMGYIIQIWRQRIVNIYVKGVAYYNQKKQVRQFVAFSQGFYFQFGKGKTGLEFGIILYGNHRKLQLQAKNVRQFIYFLFTLKFACRQSCYMALNRFTSFAPVRYSNTAKFYVDGKQYFQNLADSLLTAKTSVLMQGWMISPEFLLKRGPQSISLQNVLQILSQKQVKISIIVYHQSLFLPNHSLYLKEKLEKYKHIIVLRHPCSTFPAFWSHHTKMVIIDEELAYVGGLDITYGRFDTQSHQLFPNPRDYPGIQHNNIRRNDFFNVRLPQQSSIPFSQCRMPWHDIGHSLKGEVVKDLVYHFYQLWNFVRYQNRIPPEGFFSPSLFDSDKNQFFLIKHHGKEDKKIMKKIGGQFQNLKSNTTNMVQKLKAHIRKNFEMQLPESEKNLRLSATDNYFQRYNTEIANQIIRKEQGQTLMTGKKILGLIAMEREKDDVQMVSNFAKDIKNLTYQGQIQKYEQQTDIQEARTDSLLHSTDGDQCQVVRSVGNWSIGCHPINSEFSIHIAYLQLISKAKNYVYIENQFFISSTADINLVKNQIAFALYLRIKKAIYANQNFKVIVIIPLLPGFACDLEKEDCIIMRKEMQWQYGTICRGPKSLWQKLLKHTNDPGKYIQFLSLRTHGKFSQQSQPQTQIIYIHAKLMIVDDKSILCGSANLNDRSLTGDRDSEMAVVTRGGDFIEGMMDGEPTYVSKMAQQLRIKLWKEHFGFTKEEMIDPTSNQLWQRIKQRASNNTVIYRGIFGCYPDDTIKQKKDVQTRRLQSNIKLYDKLSTEIKGHVVQFPLKFLQDETLILLITQKQFYMPEECLT